MNSIIPQDGWCYLCGRPATETHHIFYGSGLRKVSDNFGLTVRLCRSCHTAGASSVHKCRATDLSLKEEAQRIAMDYYGWSIEDFRAIFHKNYL